MYNDMDFAASVAELVNLVYSRGINDARMVESFMKRLNLVYRKGKTFEDIKVAFKSANNKYGPNTMGMLQYLTNYYGTYVVKENR